MRCSLQRELRTGSGIVCTGRARWWKCTDKIRGKEGGLPASVVEVEKNESAPSRSRLLDDRSSCSVRVCKDVVPCEELHLLWWRPASRSTSCFSAMERLNDRAGSYPGEVSSSVILSYIDSLTYCRRTTNKLQHSETAFARLSLRHFRRDSSFQHARRSGRG